MFQPRLFGSDPEMLRVALARSTPSTYRRSVVPS